MVHLLDVADEIWIMGFDKDENDNKIPGAKIQHKFDLKAMGLTWQTNINKKPEFRSLVGNIENRFRNL